MVKHPTESCGWHILDWDCLLGECQLEIHANGEFLARRGKQEQRRNIVYHFWKVEALFPAFCTKDPVRTSE
jgi:hypothetical protein